MCVAAVKCARRYRAFPTCHEIRAPDTSDVSGRYRLLILILSLQHNNPSSTLGFGSFQTSCCGKTKGKSIGGEKHWITTQLCTLNTAHAERLVWRRQEEGTSLPCGPPCRRWARCCRRPQASPRSRAADTQTQLFIVPTRWGDVLRAEYTQEQRPGVDTAVTSSRPVL